MELEQIFSTLISNAEKGFVKRILSPEKYPTLPMGRDANGNERTSTHIMSYGEADGRYYVFPTVVFDGKGLHQLSASDASRNALENNEAIWFDSEKDASEFSQEYKRYWDAIK